MCVQIDNKSRKTIIMANKVSSNIPKTPIYFEDGLLSEALVIVLRYADKLILSRVKFLVISSRTGARIILHSSIVWLGLS
jgi:hypothetical protein